LRRFPLLTSGNRHKRRHRAPRWRQSALGSGASWAGLWRQWGWAVAPVGLGGGSETKARRRLRNHGPVEAMLHDHYAMPHRHRGVHDRTTHMNLTVYVMNQTWVGAPPFVRKLCTHFILYPNRLDRASIPYISKGVMLHKDTLRQLFDACTEPYVFC
jgi:hypothetical protein